jgi:O-antigen ligase
MTARFLLTFAALIFAIGGFCGAGPTPASLTNPFGLLFLGIAVFVWIGWKPMMEGISRPGIWDEITKGWLGFRAHRRSSSSSS